MYQHTSVLDVEVSLSCHERKARLFLRGMAPSTSEKNSGLANPQFFFSFFFFNLTYSRWTSSLPSCLWSQRIFPSLPGSRLTIFYRDASSALLQLVNQWLKEDAYRVLEEGFRKIDSYLDQMISKLKDITDEKRSMDQHETSLEHDARQPRLAMERDRRANTKTCKRTEGAATAEQAMRRDNVSARRIEPGPKNNSTSVGILAEPPALPCRNDIPVENGDASPKSCLPFLEMRSPSAAGGLLSTGEASTATGANFNKPPLRFYLTEETDSKTNWRTRILYVSYDSNFLPAAYSFWMVIETKSGENRMFDPGGSQGRLRACPFLGSWRVLLCGEVIRAGATR